jgi:hypothetical protein
MGSVSRSPPRRKRDRSRSLDRDRDDYRRGRDHRAISPPSPRRDYRRWEGEREWRRGGDGDRYRGRSISRSPSPRRERGRDADRGREFGERRPTGRYGMPPPAAEAPEAGTIHRARVVSVRPYGVFVELPGFRKQGMVHHSQVCRCLHVRVPVMGVWGLGASTLLFNHTTPLLDWYSICPNKGNCNQRSFLLHLSTVSIMPPPPPPHHSNMTRA